MQIASAERTVSHSAPLETRKQQGQAYLAFGLGGEEYALDILRVQELRNYESVTVLANMPDFIKGVVNLRGTIVPIIDMRSKLGLGTATYNEFTAVIILHIADYLIELGIVDDRRLILVDLDRLMSSGEIGLTEKLAA